MNELYEITIHGQLTPQWESSLYGMKITCLPDGNTCLTGSLSDQPALYGLLMRLRDYGLTLISVRQVKENK